MECSLRDMVRQAVAALRVAFPGLSDAGLHEVLAIAAGSCAATASFPAVPPTLLPQSLALISMGIAFGTHEATVAARESCVGRA